MLEFCLYYVNMYVKTLNFIATKGKRKVPMTLYFVFMFREFLMMVTVTAESRLDTSKWRLHKAILKKLVLPNAHI